MKLQEIQDQGFTLCAWAIKTIRGERRVVIKLGKKTARCLNLFTALCLNLFTATRRRKYYDN